MSGPFKVGEVLVGVGFVLSPERNGMECVVLRGLDEYWSRNTVTLRRTFEAFYKVQWADGDICDIRHPNLRRKRPPTGEKTVMDWFTAPAPREVEAA